MSSDYSLFIEYCISLHAKHAREVMHIIINDITNEELLIYCRLKMRTSVKLAK